jgi:hypothetical protein
MRDMSSHHEQETPFDRLTSRLTEASKPYIAAILIMAALLSIWAGLCAA